MILPGVTDWREIALVLVPLLTAINKPCPCERNRRKSFCQAAPLNRGYYNDDLVRVLLASQ